MKIDMVLATDKWQFNQDVTDVFEDMLTRSIPQYEVMREAVFKLGCEFISRPILPQSPPLIVDLGCSLGDALVPFIDKFGAYCHYHGIEISDSMRMAVTERLRGLIDRRLVTITNDDLRLGLPLQVQAAQLILSILTLQFIPIEHRQRLLTQCYERLKVGGGMIIVEKVLGNTSRLDEVFTKHYYELKTENQYTQEQIALKRASLEGVLVPITARWNEDMFSQAGFRVIDCFWRWNNFAGWVVIK